jgi:alpha-tubulin suppressor-like RCC1 family protein
MRVPVWQILALSICGCTGLYSAVDGGGDAGGGPCTLPEECSHPANSSPACSNGVCSYVCAAPLLRCAVGCCKAVAIAAGDAHTCVLTNEGGVKCWGAAATLGDGTFDARTAPVDVTGLSSRVVALSAGLVHTCALLDTGAVECWGVNTIGDGSSTPASKAKRVSLPSPASRLSSGGSHACAIADGGLFCWGSDNLGQQGTNAGGTRLLPGDVAGLVYDVTQIAAGSAHSCALLVDGGARCWGFNVAGECGDGLAGTRRNLPVIVTAVDAGILELQAGFSFNCVRTSAGVKCWGTNGQGQCGHGVVTGRALTAVDVLGVRPDLSQLALGATASHACVIQDGGVLCWGSGDHGQLGDGNLGPQNAPVQALGLDLPIAAIAPGGRHTCAVTIEGGVLCWGDNTDGQLGDGSKGGNRLQPVKVR